MKVSDSPYLSPVMHYDPEARVVVVQRRNAQTGEVASQVPSEQAVKRARQDPAPVAPQAIIGTGAAADPQVTNKPAPGSVTVIV
jgi:hypothetical protein